MSNLEIVDIKNNIEVIKNEIVTASQVNMINGLDLDDFIYHKFLNRIDPVEYCEDVLRAHLPKSRQKLHENQTALIRAVCNPKLKQVAGLMARQCIAKGSMIHTRDGKIIPIEKHPDAWLTRENADILQVKVKGGHVIYCTNNHPIMTKDGWKRADELTKKDWVCCLYSWDKFGDGKIPYHFKRSYIEKQGVFEMNDELAELCGYMTADGYFAKGQSCKFTNKNPHYISRVEQIVTKYFKDIIIKHKNNGNCDVIYFVTEKKDVENSFKDFISIMQYDKTRIPYAMNYFTKSQVSAFFRGIFAWDGWISKKIRRGRVNYEAGLSAKTSLQYAEFLRENLNKLGIRGQIKKDWFKKSTQYHYRICINGQRNYRLFLENIGEILDKPFPNIEYRKGENPIEIVIGEDSEKLYFSPVVAVNEYGKTDVYDVTYHNKGWFLCGGMKVHNSGKTESISSFCGYLIDNYPMMRVGIFTPRLQQAEVSIGRLSTFFQMNEDRLNNKIVKITKDIVELDNGSYVTAVSASDQSNIEGLTFDVIVLDEAQKVSDYTMSERVVPMGGACVVGDTEIQLLDGTTKTIKEIVEEKKLKYLPCIDFDNKSLAVGKISQFCDIGERDVIKLTLNTGQTICGTYEHPVIVKSRETKKHRIPRWERLDNVKLGYQICIPKETPFFGKIHNEHARLLGMLICDGCYSDKGSVWYGSEDYELWDYIIENYPDSKISVKQWFYTERGNLFRSARITKLTKIIKSAGIEGQKSIYKKMPIDIMCWDKESICNLIAGLIDTDGGVYIDKGITDKRCKVSISYVTISKYLAEGIQKLFLKLGIRSYISKKLCPKNDFCNSKYNYYVVSVRDKESINNFYNNIKLLVPHKAETLKRGVELLKIHKYKIPKDLVDTDMRFVKVVGIEYFKNKHVYDLTVDKYHSFIANNIFVHNTNAKIIKIGTPKTRNHFYESVEGKASDQWTVVKRDWTQCPQSWLLDATYLPDPKTGKERPYSTFILTQAMPKILKEQMFPNNPEVWTEGNLSVEDFKTQYMLEFIDGAGKFLTSDDVKILTSGEYSWLDHGIIGEHYVAGIDFAGSNPDGDSTQITVLRITRDGIKQKVFAKEFNDASYPEQMYYISNLFGGYRPRFECKKIFADYTGCGAAVVQTLQEEFGLKNIEGIIFNARDKYTNSGMNLKNAMYGKWRQEFDNKKFQYPTKERFCESKADGAGAENLNYYHRMVGEWADLEQTTTGYSVNKKIEASSGSHDDVCDADVLANFAAVAGQRSSMPKPTRGRFRV